MSEIQRRITDHRINGLNNCISIWAIGEPGPGGANLRYEVALTDGERPPIGGEPSRWSLNFQNGNPAQYVNGLSNEALLAIVIDRLRGVQGMNVEIPVTTTDGEEKALIRRTAAPFACRENACALTHLQEGLFWLQARTREREQRGVEGEQKA